MSELFEIKKPLMITDTILRDAHQSQAATRMKLEDMLPACEVLDSIGYWSIECWGGATFDACMRFLGEDPWERLRTLRKALPNTKLQMLLRGQNLLGYRHYADDMVDAFCRKYHVTESEIRKLNPSLPADGQVKAGTRIKLPGADDAI